MSLPLLALGDPDHVNFRITRWHYRMLPIRTAHAVNIYDQLRQRFPAGFPSADGPTDADSPCELIGVAAEALALGIH